MAVLPLILTNGTTADANQVMALFNEIYDNIDQTNVAAGNKTGTGKFVLQTSPSITTPTINGTLTLNKDGGEALLDLYGFGANVAGRINLHGARGTQGVPAIIQNGDLIGEVYFYGYDGVQYREGATIFAQIDAAPGAGDMPTSLVFRTTADGAASPTERMRITSAGNVGIVSGKKFNLDGVIATGDTYIQESSANVLSLVAGGVAIDISAAAVALGARTLSLSNQIISALATGTAPLIVASTTKVTNLNADLLDGLDSTDFAQQDFISSADAGQLLINIGTGVDGGFVDAYTFNYTINKTGRYLIKVGCKLEMLGTVGQADVFYVTDLDLYDNDNSVELDLLSAGGQRHNNGGTWTNLQERIPVTLLGVASHGSTGIKTGKIRKQNTVALNDSGRFLDVRYITIYRIGD